MEEGCGLDCSSATELLIAERLGVPGEQRPPPPPAWRADNADVAILRPPPRDDAGVDVMFTSNYTSKKDLATAIDQGAILNLDDVSLVQRCVEARGSCPSLVSFRLNPGLGRTDSEVRGQAARCRAGLRVPGVDPPPPPRLRLPRTCWAARTPSSAWRPSR